MRLNRLTKLSQLIKEAKEQYFNLYNDMKDSIYVEQKGRTVGDVEVLPGKTLSGCITSSDINVYYTNLMGGKDSKVISSSELMALIPSLTTKKGELSPTLNISKALINISIKKYNSANKLAELKKIAEEQPITRTLVQGAGGLYGGVTGATFGTAIPIPGSAVAGGTAGALAGSTIAGRAYDAVTGYSAEADKEKAKAKSDAEYGALADKAIAKAKSDAEYGALADKAIADAKAKADAKARPVINTEVIDDAHKGKTLTDNAGYTYVVAPDGKSLTFSINGSQPKTLNQSYKNWKSVVGNINAIPVTSSGTATPAAQTQAPAATTPTATEAAKPQQTERQFDANALAGVKAVLVRAATPGGFGLAVTTAANERARIQRMVSVIQKVIGQNIDAYDFLTKMLLVSQRGEQSLVPWFSKENYSNAIATAPRKDVVADKNGTGPFNKPVAAVLSVLNEVYSGNFADDNEGTIRKFKETFVKDIVPAQPAANTAAAPAAQTGTAPATNPGQPTTNTEAKEKVAPASQVDPRIKKLATLRRLRVRGQMEAATESSTQFGRSRVS